ncbi:aromatic ring-hydroxylating dioxygenase subunit alpha [Gordonia sp. zg691]|uniref:aromatic ring-hydroxylating oxygenase subunit alpha n=1 Tax=Gordonia jinghuaiqii TaxID=2758710 RepID=UPI001662565A|nr:aromatic ring-hydroxylating dioxygenase subunit alpha [Gordonia jinghuaiqii]MBD0859790.1 aromatic ring-hydroxylating dioxygenase subunit alpha [Gordonia jinghuaiqii]
MTIDDQRRSGRSPGVSYQELLELDTRRVPEFLRREGESDFGSADIPAEYYFARRYHELEKEHIWRKTWQFACREEVIPNVGDTEIYDVVGISILLVRTAPTTIKAYYNACLHRGRQIRDVAGPAHELRCQFHGFCWDLEGRLRDVPAQWDFPHVKPEEFALPEVRVGTWGGFVFITMDPDAPSLADFLGELPEQMDRWRMEDRYTQAHVAKVLPCNWKVAQEAFMESFHIITTHPQLLVGIGDANSQYDAFGNISRAMTPRGTPSPHLNYQPTEQEVMDAMLGLGIDDAPLLELPDDARARVVVGEASRKKLREVIGERAEELTDAECIDSYFYTVYPNFHPWGTYNRTCYRFRPNGDDPETSIMECLILSPYSGERPPPARVRWLGIDESFLEADELGPLARVFFQDEYNVGWVQKGLHTLVENKPGVTFGNYQETKIRHFYSLYLAALGLTDDE